MANNGYLILGVCSSLQDKAIDICNSWNTGWHYAIPHIVNAQFPKYSPPALLCVIIDPVYKNSWFAYPSFDCEIGGASDLSKIPTVADGVTLGWQAGGALILVGCLLFLKKVFK